MPTYVLTGPDGKKYKVTGDTPEGAVSALKKSIGAGGPPPSMEDRVNTFTGGVLEGVPIVGPAIRGGLDRVGAAIAAGIYDDTTYDQALQRIQRGTARNKEALPGTDVAGQLTGAVAPFVAAGAVPAAAKALGMSGPLMSRIGLGAVSNAAIGGADTLARGGDAGDAARSAAISGAIGAAAPVVAKGLQAGWQAIKKPFAPASTADDILANAFRRDRVTGNVLSAGDDVAARANNQPVLNVDRGGETVRALARDVANKSPEARDTIKRAVQDRYEAQSGRVVDLFSKITGGRTDDVALRETLRSAARASNKPAYDAAYQSPAAASLWDDTLQRMTSSPAVRAAIADVESRSADRAVVEGFKAVRNPFNALPDGTLGLKPGVSPSLQFWDHVQRNLREAADRAARAGDNSMAADLGSIRRMLNQHLDAAVPQFNAARSGAAAFFAADDAIEAGQKFASQTRNLNQARSILNKMKPIEKKAFAFGFASEIVSKAKAAPDSRNVINSVFGSQEARQKMAMTFGATQAREIEAFVRVEQAMDKMRGALGNSTTAQQLLQSIGVGGLGAGAAGIYSGYDPTTMGAGALAAIGARRGLAAVASGMDDRVMSKVAEKLLSNDPKAIDEVLKLAAGNPQAMAAVDRLAQIADGVLRGGAIAAGAAAASQPQ